MYGKSVYHANKFSCCSNPGIPVYFLKDKYYYCFVFPYDKHVALIRIPSSETFLVLYWAGSNIRRLSSNCLILLETLMRQSQYLGPKVSRRGPSNGSTLIKWPWEKHWWSFSLWMWTWTLNLDLGRELYHHLNFYFS